MADDERTSSGREAAGGVTSVAAGALLLAASNLLSRILGYGRDIVLGGYEGSSPAAGAYFAAFQLPDLLNYLLAGGALSIAFLPLYTRARSRDEAEAKHLLGSVLGSLSIAAVGITAVAWIAADGITQTLYPRFEGELSELTTELTRIVLPAQIFFLAGGILNASLLARGRFWAAALAPLLYNLSIIGFGMGLHPWIGVRGFAVGVLVGSVAGPFLAPLVSCLRSRVPLEFRFAPLDPQLRTYLWIAAPLMLGQSLLTVDEWFDRFFGAMISPEVVAWLSYARKLMLVPVAVAGQAIAAAALPAFARLYNAGQIDELNRAVIGSLRAGLGIGVLLSLPLAAFATPIVVLVYQRGEFNVSDSMRVAQLLQLLALAAPSWIAQQILVRAFYARGDTWRPMLLGTVVVLLALPLYWGLAREFEAVGLALAGVVAMAINVASTLVLARTLHGAPALPPLLDTLGRNLSIGLLGSLGGLAICAALFGPSALGIDSLPGAAIEGMRVKPLTSIQSALCLLAAGTSYALIALPLAVRFGDPPTRATLTRLLGRILGRLRPG